MKKIAYKTDNNGVAILIPSPFWTGTLEQLAFKDIPENTPWQIIESPDIPSDITFRNAWELEGSVIKPNIEKSKQIWLNRFREARTPKLQKLDVDFMKAVEAGDEAKKAEIIAAKQALRDVTLTPLPNDIEGIKATWPDILN